MKKSSNSPNQSHEHSLKENKERTQDLKNYI